MTTVIDLPYPPSSNARQRVGWHGRPYITRKTKEWRLDAGWLLLKQKPEPIVGQYHLKLLAKRPDKRRRDADNLLKEVSDLLVKHKVVQDDSLALSAKAEWSDAIPDGCRVILTPVE